VNRGSQRLRLALVILVLISFSLITLDHRSDRGGALGGLRDAVDTVFGPIQRGFGSIFHPIGTFASDVFHAHSRGDRARALQQQVDELQKQLRGNGDIERSRKELNALVTLAGEHQYTLIPARVTSVGGLSGFDNAATLNAGSRDGIKENMTVINGQGLVGRVVRVTPFTSTIALAIDPDLRFYARMVRGGEIGIASGHGQGPMTFTPNSATVFPKKGDVIETFGTTTYAAGVPVGRVLSVSATPGATTKTAQVASYVDFTALDVVGVVVPTQRSATAQPTTPPLPTVTVTVTAPPTTPPPETSAGATAGASGGTTPPAGG